VNSTIIKLKPKYNILVPIGSEMLYYQFIKIIFKQPRKTILNNLAAGTKIDKNKIVRTLNTIGLSGKERPQALDIATLIKLSGLFPS